MSFIEERYTYYVVPKRPIRGIIKGKVINKPMNLSLTKEEVKTCMKYGAVFRKFYLEKEERVVPSNIDRLHRAKHISERDYILSLGEDDNCKKVVSGVHIDSGSGTTDPSQQINQAQKDLLDREEQTFEINNGFISAQDSKKKAEEEQSLDVIDRTKKMPEEIRYDTEEDESSDGVYDEEVDTRPRKELNERVATRIGDDQSENIGVSDNGIEDNVGVSPEEGEGSGELVNDKVDQVDDKGAHRSGKRKKNRNSK